MVVIHSYGWAVFLAFITMLCWGSWANTQKLAQKHWPFQLLYWDYAIGVLLLALALAFTAGSMGTEGRSFLTDLAQADFKSLFSAFLGGVIFNIANIPLVAAIAIAGMAVAFPIGIGLVLALGVITNYTAAPLGNPVILFSGVALVIIAIILDTMAYRKLPGSSSVSSTKGIMVSLLADVAKTELQAHRFSIPSDEKGKMQLQIEYERIWELSGEHLRFFDLARWGYFQDESKRIAIAYTDPDFNYPLPAERNRQWIPMPNLEIDNNPGVRQNPGY